ncbi:MAG TPA: hypothetical protein VIO64_14470 [Pseudobacteroides sp.]|uniref:hypothetical protein n=1 Tax=Pseudobacteroides sp. TaxID=1968840 RepID=UPI002F957FEB
MSKFLNLFFKKGITDETEADSLDILLPNITNSLCNVEFKFHNHIQNENPFSLDIEFKYTPQFTELLLSSGIVIKLSYDRLYKKLSEKKQLVQQLDFNIQKENDDVISSFVRIFKASECTIDSDSLKILSLLDEAMHFLGRIPNKDFMRKYKKAVELAFNCRVFENTDYALNLNIDIDESADDDSELAFGIINNVLNSSCNVCKSFSSSKERTRFSGYCESFIYDLCRYLVKLRYHSLDKARQDIFIDYYSNSSVYSPSMHLSEKDECILKSSIENDYRIEHYIGTDNNKKHYYFKIIFVNEYVIQRLNLGNLEKSLEESLEYLRTAISITTRTKLMSFEDGYKCSSYIINCYYTGKLLADHIENFLNKYIEAQKQIIKDYISERVKKELT